MNLRSLRSRRAALAAAVVLIAAPAAPALAQDPAEQDGGRQPGAFYASAGVTMLHPSGPFERTGDQGAGVALGAVVPLPTTPLRGWLESGLSVRLEFTEMEYGSAAYIGSDPAFAGDEIYAGVRTRALGLQVTRPGNVIVRPYGALLAAQTTMLLDAERAGKLARRDGAGAIARAGTYLALGRGDSPIVLDLGAAFHWNGVRAHWRPGEVQAVRGSVDFFELVIGIGVATHLFGDS